MVHKTELASLVLDQKLSKSDLRLSRTTDPLIFFQIEIPPKLPHQLVFCCAFYYFCFVERIRPRFLISVVVTLLVIPVFVCVDTKINAL